MKELQLCLTVFYTTHTISPYLSNRFTIQHDRSVDGKCVPKVRTWFSFTYVINGVGLRMKCATPPIFNQNLNARTNVSKNAQPNISPKYKYNRLLYLF
jgi:hypothetical protein